MPTKRAKAKSLKVDSPKSSRAVIGIRVFDEVYIERFTTCRMDVFASSLYRRRL